MAETNSTILRAAYLDGTSDFQQRVPDPTQSGIASMADFLFSYDGRVYYNQFCDWLVNRIGFTYVKSQSFTNPLAVFKRPMLARGGNTIQSLAFEYIRAHAYTDDDGEGNEGLVFKTYRPKGKAAYVSLNRRDQYPISVNRIELQQAFLSGEDGTGLNEFIAGIMDLPASSDNYDEYRCMLQLWAEFDRTNHIYRHAAYANEPQTEDEARAFLVDLNAYADELSLPNNGVLYSVGELPVTAKPDQLVLFIKARPKAVMNVQGLATLFHIDRAEVPYRVIYVDDFGIDNCFAILTTERAYLCADVAYEAGSIYDPRRLNTNYYLTHFSALGLDPFEPMIMFGYGDAWNATSPLVISETPTALTLTADSTTVEPGGVVKIGASLTATLTASVAGESTEPIEAAPDSVTYVVSAAKSASDDTAVTLNSRTYVDPLTGLLHVQKSGLSKGNVITVTGTSTYIDPTGDTAAPASASVTIVVA